MCELGQRKQIQDECICIIKLICVLTGVSSDIRLENKGQVSGDCFVFFWKFQLFPDFL